MKKISVTILDRSTGEESDTELTLNNREYHLIGHMPYVTDDFEVVAVNGERLNEETGTYYSEREATK
jgi:hypothetical protein